MSEMANPSGKQGEPHTSLRPRSSGSLTGSPLTDSLEDSGDVEYTELHDVTDLTKHCILFAVNVLAPKGLKLPATGTHRIEGFCQTILQDVESYRNKRKLPNSLPETTLVPQNEVLRFYEGVCSPKEFAQLISQSIAQKTDTNFSEDSIHRQCWNIYYTDNKAELVYPRWLSTEASRNLWLVFCSLLSKMELSLNAEIINDVLQKIFKLAGYTWDSGFQFSKPECVLFPTFLEAIVDCLSALQLDASLVNEMMDDLRDEVVFGVLRKGYLFKKGHKRKNWSRRWFILQRNVLTYHTSRDKLDEKGRIVLNCSTEVKPMEDKGSKKHKFSVTCGGTSTPYEISADDNRSRNEWILDISKAIQLEQALFEESGQGINQRLARFYTLKYGTASPNLHRLDSTIRHTTIVSNPLKKEKLEYCAQKPLSARDYEHPCSTSPVRVTSDENWGTSPMSPASVGTQSENQCSGGGEEYTDMSFNPDVSTDQDHKQKNLCESNSGTDDEGYTFMYRGRAKEDKAGEVGNEEQLSDNAFSDTYDKCDFSPRYHPKSKDEGDAEELGERSLTMGSVELENVSDFLKCTLPSSPTKSATLSIAKPVTVLLSDSSLINEPLPSYLDVLPRVPNNRDGDQAPPVPPRQVNNIASRRQTSASPSHSLGLPSRSQARAPLSATSSLNISTSLGSPTSTLPELPPSAQFAFEDEEGQYYITPPQGPKGKVASRNIT